MEWNGRVKLDASPIYHLGQLPQLATPMSRPAWMHHYSRWDVGKEGRDLGVWECNVLIN